MEYGAETVWRKGLQARGKDWVLSELHRRPGQPEDVLYDVVFKEPYPTRAFCFQWCAEEENKVFRMSWHTYAMIIAMALLIVSILKGISALDDEAANVQLLQAKAMAPATGSHGTSGSAGAGAGGSTTTSDITSTNTSSGSGSTSSSSGSASSSSGSASSSAITSPSGSALTTGLPDPASICGYITYDSPRCPHQN